MGNKSFSLFVLLFISTYSFSQVTKPNPANTKSQWSLNTGLTNFGLGYEASMSRKTTIIFDAGIGWTRLIYKYQDSYSIDISFPAVYVSINPRLYYNLDKRVKKGKSISNNAANYIGLLLKATTYPIGQNYGPDVLIGSSSIDLHWGIQRNLGKSWLIDIKTGIGANHNSGYGTNLYPALNIRFAKIIFRNK